MVMMICMCALFAFETENKFSKQHDNGNDVCMFLWWHICIRCLAFVVFSYLRSLRMLDRAHIGQDGDIANLWLFSNMSAKSSHNKTNPSFIRNDS